MSKEITQVVVIDVQQLEHLFSRVIDDRLTQHLKIFPVKVDEDDDGYIDITAASKLLHKAKSTIYGQIKEIPHIKRGKLLFKEDELLKWLKDGKQQTFGEEEAEMNKSLLGKKRG